MPEEAVISFKKRKNWGLLFLLFCLFIAVGFFTWRVFHYSNLIRSGELVDLRLAQTKEMSISRLAAAAAATQGSSAVDINNEPSFGNITAPLTVVVFADFSCPYSRESSFVMRGLSYKDSETVRYVYKDFPLTDLHPEAINASEAAACANEQGKFWEMHDRLYMNQSDFSRDTLLEHARALDFEMGQFISCFDSQKYKEGITKDYDEGLALGVYGTPTFFLNGQKVEGAMPADFLQGIIEKIKKDNQQKTD